MCKSSLPKSCKYVINITVTSWTYNHIYIITILAHYVKFWLVHNVYLCVIGCRGRVSTVRNMPPMPCWPPSRWRTNSKNNTNATMDVVIVAAPPNPNTQITSMWYMWWFGIITWWKAYLWSIIWCSGSSGRRGEGWTSVNATTPLLSTGSFPAQSILAITLPHVFRPILCVNTSK